MLQSNFLFRFSPAWASVLTWLLLICFGSRDFLCVNPDWTCRVIIHSLIQSTIDVLELLHDVPMSKNHNKQSFEFHRRPVAEWRVVGGGNRWTFAGKTKLAAVSSTLDHLLSTFCVSDLHLCFNFDTKNSKIIWGSKETQFGYTVQQHEAGGRQWWEL